VVGQQWWYTGVAFLEVWSTIELREIEVFLTLAEELHFGRTAERLRLTPSRVSQLLRGLEHKVGGQLLTRTSRSASLTQLGERFIAEVRPPYDELRSALERTSTASRSLRGALRLGVLAANSGGPHLTMIVNEFERLHPECEVDVQEVLFTDPLGPLRRGEIDVMTTAFPLRQSDLTVGPTLIREPMVLAVSENHPLAGRKQVALDDIADYQVAPITDAPKELVEAAMPRRAPNGRVIRRLRRRPKTPHEVTALVARGQVVHPTVPSFAQYFGQPGVTYIPIADMPPRESGLVWRRRDSNPRLRELIRISRAIIADTRR
jgi:DNA-binding transcriptional LysR family regulator